jgi:hypothetical protein
MITLYDKDGNPKAMDGVDAREHLATGRWFSSPPEKLVEDEPVAEVKRGRPKSK